eukprot:TRINITY_DN901_c0_g1_i2.p1 TRINITY_DN901_c0_g1~~TRINITY_DN901_c0_g1_i2.p1  ORF type:complete len:260 (-),score=95.62 TRINITY_DN901_c0_g1_i2:26-805(-)
MFRIPTTAAASALKASPLVSPLGMTQLAMIGTRNSRDYVHAHIMSNRNNKQFYRQDHLRLRTTDRSRYLTQSGDEIGPRVDKSRVLVAKKQEKKPKKEAEEEKSQGTEKKRGVLKTKSAELSPNAKFLLKSLLKKTRTSPDLSQEDGASLFETERKAIDTLISRGYTEKLTLDGSKLLLLQSGESYEMKYAKLAEIHRIEKENDPESGTALLGLKILTEGGQVVCKGIMEISNDDLKESETTEFLNWITSNKETVFIRK